MPATRPVASRSANEFTEIEFAVQATTNATDGANYCFRLTNSGAALNTYDKYAEATLAAAPVTTSYRSIGTNTGTLYNTGNASITINTTTVTFGGGASLPVPTAVGAVGVGDRLVIGADTFYILSRDDATHATVQTAATATHTNEAYTITRAYNDIQSWETGRQGGLVAGNRIEGAVAGQVKDLATSSACPFAAAGAIFPRILRDDRVGGTD